MSLSDWMASENIPGIYGVDTRRLVKRIRQQESAMVGAISTSPAAVKQKVHWNQQPKQYGPAQWSCGNCEGLPGGCIRILVLDFGLKHGIVSKLLDLSNNSQIEISISPGSTTELEAEMKKKPFHGLLLSNGPGDPKNQRFAIAQLQKLFSGPSTLSEFLPILGICLGHQLISLAAGGGSSKLKFGHRGHNHPVVFSKDTKLGFISSQNHGFFTTFDFLRDWAPLYTNLNDNTSAGIYHRSRPIMSSQWHPEGGGGPKEVGIFKAFFNSVKEYAASGRVNASWPPGDEHLRRGARSTEECKFKRVLVLGSGGLQIGQAGEFDYSGAQALKALKALGIKTVLLNPNVASVQTIVGTADDTVFAPLSVASVVRIFNSTVDPPIDGLLLSFGGQTALNLGLELEWKGFLRDFNVKIMGTATEGILLTEDREKFRGMLLSIRQPIAPSITASTKEEILSAAKRSIGYPVLLRRAFALGGYGSGFAKNEEELGNLVSKAMARRDPGGKPAQMIIDKSLKGWKEVEYEVMRDRYGNCFTICNMENFDPLGVHTGESIVVAPSQTLSDFEYQTLREASIAIANRLGIVGECNVQYAVNPNEFEYVVVEVNPRLSRSSALASKATGYPIAHVAAQLAAGKSLAEINNLMTKTSPALMEPALDYVVVKIPHWDFQMFDGDLDTTLNTGMKSIGEVMGIGRTFPEAFQKALRMVGAGEHVQGFGGGRPGQSCDSGLNETQQCQSPGRNLKELLATPSPKRPFQIAAAFEEGWTAKEVADASGVGYWFLGQLYDCFQVSLRLKVFHSLQDVPTRLMREAKMFGYSDLQISRNIFGAGAAVAMEPEVRNARVRMGITPIIKQIDTTAGEFPAASAYFYMTYGASGSAESDYSPLNRDSPLAPILIIGSGVYRIGSSVEFDHSVVSCSRTIKSVQPGRRTVVLNHNPETVSTDYDEVDALYFEEISVERVLDILDAEGTPNVIVSMGGQTAQNLVPSLEREPKSKVNILGTSPSNIRMAEDRHMHSQMLDDIGVHQALWTSSAKFSELAAFASKHFPVLVRPSFVLAGAAMKVVRDRAALDTYVQEATRVSPDYPVVLSKYEENGEEIDIDAVCRDGKLVAFAVSEHIEAAGVHSGDATMIHPPHSLPKRTIDACKVIAGKIGRRLQISGPFNLQIIYTRETNELKVIETNLRASRSMPFVSRASGVDFARVATVSIMGYDPAMALDTRAGASEKVYGVKTPVFSFDRLPGADILLGVTMKATGEVACFHKDVYKALLCAINSAGRNFPAPHGQSGATAVCLHAKEFSGDARTQNLALRMEQMGYEVKRSCSIEDLSLKRVELLLEFSSLSSVGSMETEQGQFSQRLRRQAIDANVNVFTQINLVETILAAIQKNPSPLLS
jgi:carbamoyl-phosphate synthase large subunit/carbamoyl-phosphate synthase small subunit